MITPRDLRDIAAYWGATCDYSYQGEFGTLEHCNRPVSEFIGAVLQHGIETVADAFSVKVRLRKVDTLTDAEIGDVIRVVNPKFTLVKIYRCENHVSVDGEEEGKTWEISYTFFPQSGIFREGNYYSDFEYPLDDYTIGAYLQSIGVYVPGTIREELVF